MGIIIIKWIFNTALSFNKLWNTKIYKNEPRFNGFFSRDNLHKIKDGAYVINLDEYSDIGTHWVALCVQNNNNNNNNNKITTIIFRVQVSDSIMCGYFCIGFIDFMVAGKTLTEYANLFSPKNFKKSDDIILNYSMSNIQNEIILFKV